VKYWDWHVDCRPQPPQNLKLELPPPRTSDQDRTHVRALNGPEPNLFEGLQVLAIDDDHRILGMIERTLTSSGCEVVVTTSGHEGVKKASSRDFDIILLDGMMPDLPGVDVARQLRTLEVATPILMVTGVTRPDFLISALDAGADDFLNKPYNTRELEARIMALVRRSRSTYEVTRGRVKVDGMRSTVVIDDIEVRLTSLQLRILSELLRANSEFVTHAQLLASVWDIDFDPGTNLVYTHIANIRRKLEDQGLTHLIETSRGKGYRLNLE
jgi:two-component system, OmpR family, response regulator